MSDKATYDSVKQTLPLLSETQLKDIMNRCKVLMSRELTSDDWLLDGIITELRLLGIPVPGLDKITHHNQFRSFSEKSAALRTVLEEQGITTRTEKRQLAKIVSKCLIEYLRGFTEISLMNMMTFIDHIPQALERAFPGYLSSGMLPFVIGKTIPERMVH